MSSIRILGEDDVRELIDSAAALALARRTLRDQAVGADASARNAFHDRQDRAMWIVAGSGTGGAASHARGC